MHIWWSFVVHWIFDVVICTMRDLSHCMRESKSKGQNNESNWEAVHLINVHIKIQQSFSDYRRNESLHSFIVHKKWQRIVQVFLFYYFWDDIFFTGSCTFQPLHKVTVFCTCNVTHDKTIKLCKYTASIIIIRISEQVGWSWSHFDIHSTVLSPVFLDWIG